MKNSKKKKKNGIKHEFDGKKKILNIKHLAVLTGLFAVFVLLFIIYVVLDAGPDCYSYSHYHVYCLGCGMTRSIRSMMTLKFYQAFRYNVLLMPLFIPGLIVLFISMWQYLFGVELDEVLLFQFIVKFWIPITVIIVLYVILRNFIPALAPYEL